jgi:hypothetical protein
MGGPGMGDPMGGSGMDGPMGGPDMEGPGMEGGEEGMDSEGGVGADVKKYSGELSQALNSYNEENPDDDEKINKYAINMIAAQVADYLSDKDKRNVIKKLKGDEDDMSSDEQPMPGDEGESDDMMPQMEMENRIVREITDELLNGRKPTKRDERFITNSDIEDESPFTY